MGRRSDSLAGPTLLPAVPQIFSTHGFKAARSRRKKGYLNARLEGRNRVYSPKVRPQTVIRETVGEMVDLLFDGQAMPLMKHLVEERKFSADDIDQLRQLLDRLEGDQA